MTKEETEPGSMVLMHYIQRKAKIDAYENAMDAISLLSMNGDEQAVIRARDAIRKLRDNV